MPTTQPSSGRRTRHLPAAEIDRLTSRFVAPVPVAPHVAGAAVDLTLVDRHGRELDLGTPIDATPEQSGGRCYSDAEDISAEARHHRQVLARALRTAGLVNYPTEWWHWSFGDRYWALLTRAPAALYGPVDLRVAAA
ncbi:D-alanyl-D-alanine dipeptidase [Marmoricola sp. URHA0025 HA25]